ncbi:MAG TPA: hypothetical protein PKL30_18665 [Leptospiraceae bacterium]|nr:hypothetical protein [Leptospiraceae bacterium]
MTKTELIALSKLTDIMTEWIQHTTNHFIKHHYLELKNTETHPYDHHVFLERALKILPQILESEKKIAVDAFFRKTFYQDN